MTNTSLPTVIIAVIIAVCLLILGSCSSKCELRIPDEMCDITIKVTYTDSSIDTLHFRRESLNGFENRVFLSTENACLKGETRHDYEVICCGVRKFEVLLRESTIAPYTL